MSKKGTMGKTNDGKEVIKSTTGGKYTVDRPSYSGLGIDEVNHESSKREIKEAERNSSKKQ